MGERLALVHAEVSEALEADRNGRRTKEKSITYNNNNFCAYRKLLNTDDEYFKKHFLNDVKDTFEDELADVIIRCFDIAESQGIDIEAHILLKMRYNSMREYKHGNKKY